MLELEKSSSLDPLLKDLSEKKQSFRRNLVSWAADLNDARSQLASQEESFACESLTRQVAEMRARSMEEEICRLEKSLEERNGQLQVSASTAEQYLKELGGLRSQLSVTQAIADANASSAQSVELHCLALLKELDEKNSSLKEQEDRVNKLGEQLDHLQKNLQSREIAQKQLQNEVVRIEQEIMNAVAKAGASRDCELRRILAEVSPKNFETINKQSRAKDEEIARLRDEIKFISTHGPRIGNRVGWFIHLYGTVGKTSESRSGTEEKGAEVRILSSGSTLPDAEASKGGRKKGQSQGTERSVGYQETEWRLQRRQTELLGELWLKIQLSMSMLVLVVFSKW